MSKCEFGKTSLLYLGHIFGGGELKIDPSKIKVIVDWPKPNNVTKVRIFLGATQYFEKVHFYLFFNCNSMTCLEKHKEGFLVGRKEVESL